MRGGGSCHVFMQRFRRAGRVWGTVDLCRHLPTQEFSLLLLNNERLYYYLHSSSTLLSPSYFGRFKDLGFRSFSVLRNPLGFPHCWRGSQEEEDPQSKCNEDEKKNEQQYGGNHIGSASNWIGFVGTISPHGNGHGLRRDRAVWGHGFMPLLFKLPSGSAARFYCSGSTIKQHNNNDITDPSKRAVVTALWCNFLVFSLKAGVWFMTASHVMFAEVVHSAADFANQALLAYGLSSSRRAPDALHPYGYSKERFVWSLISAVGIFCLGCGATIVHGIQNLWVSQPPTNILLAALVIGGSFVMEGTSLIVAISAVRKGATAEGMTIRDYLWRGHDPTSVAVMMEDGAAVTGLVIAALSLVAVNVTGNPIYDPLGSIFVGQLLGMVAIFLIQRNRHALIGRAIDPHDMKHVLNVLASDQVVDAIYDCKSEVIGPGSFRFKAEIDFNGVAIVQNYLQRTGRETWAREFREAVNNKDESALDRIMANYGEEVVSALGYEVDRLEKEIQRIVPGIQHVDIETHNPKGPSP